MKELNFLKFTKIYFLISLIVLIPGLVSLGLWGLRLSIDFTGGTLLEIKTEANQDKIKQLANANNFDISSLQPSEDSTYLLRLKSITQDQNTKFQTQLASESGSKVEEKRFETVGPVIGAELTKKAIFSIILSSVFIILYIAWSFKNIPKGYSSWKFGVSAVVALLHDALLLLGVFSLLGHFLHVEVDSLFVTAVLTVIGFSVHDTIVVFDRIRENLIKHPTQPFSQVVNFSLSETLVRSINTSVTVTLSLVALLIFGGESIRWFVLALLIGIISGTYSSIFNAAPLLALWEGKKAK